ncbi:ATP-binding protein [Paenibacillus harenae]|uniref:ATP-binding protein n=1 Tax=Paenibacillus harenae TaxID=306543 RepID=UPI0004044655|nr:ATP-binding protein [Paenibacillus harenae]
MTANKKTIVILMLFLIAITGIRLTWLHIQKPLDHPQAVNGTLDLHGWNLPDNRTITLNGEWEFFPARMLESEEDVPPSEGGEEKKYIQVPGKWKHAFPDKRNGSLRYGTYKLKILLGDNADNQTLKLRINEIRSASAVYVNGQPAEGAGQPAEETELHQARNIPYSVSLPPGEQLELMIQVSNHAGNGGITKSIHFGSVEAINHRILLSISLQVILCVVFLVHGLYAVMLYLLGAANKGMFYFAMVILSAVLSVVVADEKLLYLWLPLPYEATVKIALLTYTSVVAFIPPLLRQLFPEFGNAKALRLFAGFCTLYALFILIAPMSYVLAFRPVLSVVLLLSVIFSAHILQSAIRKDKDAIYLLIACSSLGANIVWTVISARVSYEMMHYPFDLIITVLSFAAFWFKRFFRSNAQTRLLADQLQLANKQKDDFLVNTSHELRNPLHGIMNITQSLLDDRTHPANEEHRERLEIQIAVARRMSLLLDDLIDVTRLNEKTIQLQLKSVHVQSVLTGIIEMLRFMLDGKPVSLHIDMADSFPAVKADENRLIQIVFNLLHNAIKFTDEGTIAVSASIAGGMAHIHVRDTGIGMNEETQQRIFSPYEQGESNRSRSSGGFGLGLSISKQLIELHGGSISVDSSPGQGSVFTVTLPLSENADHPMEAGNFSSDVLALPSAAEADAVADMPAAASAAAANKPKLLLVDDDNVNLKVLTDILCTVQYEIATATSASKAIAMLKSAHFDLIISDVMMPHISGYELTRLIRERFTISELPVLLLTARNRSEDIYAGFQAGANDYVAKPVNAWELRSRVHALVELKSSIEERLRMEAAWLQAQIQPHFLFNTLNSIAALGTMDIDKMQALLEKFSHYLRTSFDFHNSNRVVSIDRELALVQSYLFIEKERFGGRLEVQWELDADIHLLLPPLSLQTLVENAVNHGILRRAGGGIITIRIENAEDCFEVSVHDNGVGMPEEKIRQALDKPYDAGKGIGLRNTDRRLKQLYNNKGLHIRSAPGQGTTVAFQIPK